METPSGWAVARPAHLMRLQRCFRRVVCGVGLPALVGLLVLLPERPAEARARLERLEDVFAVLDRNADGVVDFAEFQINKMQVFHFSDRNEDGFLSFEEMQISREAFDAADRDGDGRLSGLEFVDAEFTDFFAYDANGDGVLSFEEFRSFADLVTG